MALTTQSATIGGATKTLIVAADGSSNIAAAHVTVDASGVEKGITANPLVISAAALPLPTGAASSANQSLEITAINAVTTAITAATAPTGAGTPAAASRTVSALSSTGTQTSVAAAATDTTILAANAARLGSKVYNDSTATLYLLLASGTSSTTNYSVQVGPGALFEDATYAGVLKGVWSAANGAARVTELS